MNTRRMGANVVLLIGIVAIAGTSTAAQNSEPQSHGTDSSASVPAQTAPTFEAPHEIVDVFGEMPEPQQQQALERDWQAHQKSIHDALETSGDAREMALVAFGYAFEVYGDTDPNRRERRIQTIEKAVRMAPNDSLVLWMALSSRKYDRSSDAFASILSKLKTIESDNAAVWNEELSGAAERSDSVGVDAALKKMATSSMFNTHYSDIAKLMVSVYERHPIPDELVARDPRRAPQASISEMSVTYASSMTNAFAMPAMQHVVRACRIEADGTNADRSADCNAIGRLLSAKADTLVGVRIGFAILRVSHTFNDDDIRAARSLDWIVLKQHETLDEMHVEQYAQHYTDWIAAGGELEAARRMVGSAGIAPSPPTEWIDESSPFSSERFEADERARTFAK